MTNVYYDIDKDDDDLTKKLEKLCSICGHKLSHHRFVDRVDQYNKFNDDGSITIKTLSHYLSVSQCVFCDCREYKE